MDDCEGRVEVPIGSNLGIVMCVREKNLEWKGE